MSIFYFIAAAGLEISGCFAFWAWLRLGKSPLWLIPGIAALILFAYLLSRSETAFAGRAYAAWYENFINLWRKFGVEDPAYASTLETARQRDAIIAGTPDMVASEIERQIEAAGLNYFVCRFAYGDLSFEEASGSFDRFAPEVMPRFA